MQPIRVVFPVALLIVLLAVVGLVVLLSKSRRAGLVLLGVGVLLLLGLFLVRIGVHRGQVSLTQVRIGGPPVRSHLDLPSAPVLSPIWLTDVEDQFRADVYPSIRSAAQALGRELTSLLPTVVADNQTPSVAQVCGRVEPEKISSDVLNAVGDSLGQENDAIQVMVETIVPEEPIEQTNPRAVTIRVSLPRWGTRAIATGEEERLERSGTLRAHVTGTAGQLTRTVQFTEKPWVENFGAFVNSNPQRQFILARSQSSCTNVAEADRQAMSDACRQVAEWLNEMRPKNTVLPEDIAVYPGDLRNGRFISDKFTQSFEGAAGRIWRQSLLIDASQEKLNRLAQVKTGQIRAARTSWAHIVFSALGMIVLICVVYFFLDAATRGYYTLVLRVAAAVLIAAAIFFILSLS
jgi:hypothetical protein